MRQAQQKAKRIALALPLDVVYIERLVPGILEFAREQGNWTFTRLVERLSPSIEWLRDWEGDGAFVLITTPADARIARSLRMPVVNVGGYFRDAGVPTVTVDHQAIGRLAAEHLLERRFRRFGYYGKRGLWYSHQRRMGFQTAIKAAGGQCEVLEVPDYPARRQKWGSQEEQLGEWLRSLRPPVGIMASWDLRARMVLEACAEAGLRVPEDVGIVGVDNDPIVCEFSAPPLSSVARNDQEVGRQAAVLLHQLIKGAHRPKHPVLIPPRGVVPRRSTQTVAIEDPVVAALAERIRQHLGKPFGVEDLLAHAPLSRRRLEQRFRKSLGSTPYAFINTLRVEKAKSLLAEPNKTPLTAIAAACGFSDLRRFRLVFRRLAKQTPAEYRRACREHS